MLTKTFTIAGIKIRAIEHPSGLRTLSLADVKKLFPVAGGDAAALDLPEMVEMMTWLNAKGPDPLSLDFARMERLRAAIHGPAQHQRRNMH